MTRDDLIYLYPEFAKTIQQWIAEDKLWMSRDALRGELIPTIGLEFVRLSGVTGECTFVVFKDGSLWLMGEGGRIVLIMEIIRRL